MSMWVTRTCVCVIEDREASRCLLKEEEVALEKSVWKAKVPADVCLEGSQSFARVLEKANFSTEQRLRKAS
jgi:hypothetical protein